MELPEVPGRHPNYKDISHIDFSHTESSHSVRTAGIEPAGEQAQLDRILKNCELWIFDPDTAKVFANAVERLFYTNGFRIGNAMLPQANVRSRLGELDSIILQSVQGKLKSNQREVKNSTAYVMAVIFNAISEAHSDILVDPYLNQIGAPPEP